jgi:hypothetical protein
MLVIPIAERNNDFWQRLHIHNRGRLTNVVLNEVGITASHSATRVVIGLSRLNLRTPAARQMAQKALQRVRPGIGQIGFAALQKMAPMCRDAEVVGCDLGRVPGRFECVGKSVDVRPTQARSPADQDLGAQKYFSSMMFSLWF